MPEYYTRLAAAYVCGKLAATPTAMLTEEQAALLAVPLDALTTDEQHAIIALGLEHGLRLHRFKRTMELPRVRKVLGILKGLRPANLLDVGSGRGAFLWPLLDAFPALPVTVIDVLDYRVDDVLAVRAGGVTTLSALHGDVATLDMANATFDVVTMLEVLEHIPDTDRALAAVSRLAQRATVFSVPSKADDNPEHIHLFDQLTITALLQRHGMARISVEYVLNHMIVVARK